MRAGRGWCGAVNDPAPFCLPCKYRPECLELDPKPALIWLWNRVGILDKQLQLTRRGRIMACFSGAEGLGVLAGLEDEKYPLNDLLEDMANLVAGDRFCGNEPRWGGRLAYACQKAYRRFTSEGFLVDGMPVNYGAGGAEIVRSLRTKKYVPMEGLEDHVHRGDVDRLLIEWKSLLRQIADGDRRRRRGRAGPNSRRSAAPSSRNTSATSLPGLPVIPAEQQKPISHRLAMTSY